MTNLHYTTFGTGKLQVLLIHGWASSMRMWQRVIDDMQDVATFHALDLAGFGQSPRPELPPTLLNHVESVREFCNISELQPDVIMGHSMGGMITLQLLRDNPQLTQRFVLIGSVVTGRFGIEGLVASLLRTPAGVEFLRHSSPLWKVAQNEQIGEVGRWVLSSLFDERMVERVMLDWWDTQPETGIESLLSLAQADTTAFLPEIEIPALVIAGDHDYTVPYQESAIAAHSLPNARFHLIEGAHHLPPDEAPDATLPLIRAFLEEVTPRAHA